MWPARGWCPVDLAEGIARMTTRTSEGLGYVPPAPGEDAARAMARVVIAELSTVLYKKLNPKYFTNPAEKAGRRHGKEDGSYNHP